MYGLPQDTLLEVVNNNTPFYLLYILSFPLTLLAFLACNGCQKVFHEKQVAPSPSTKAKICMDSRWGQPVTGEVKELTPL